MVRHHVLAAPEELLVCPHPQPPLPAALMVDGPDLPPLTGLDDLQVWREGWRPSPRPLSLAGLAGPGDGEGDQHGGLASPETKHAADWLAWEIRDKIARLTTISRMFSAVF